MSCACPLPYIAPPFVWDRQPAPRQRAASRVKLPVELRRLLPANAGRLLVALLVLAYQHGCTETTATIPGLARRVRLSERQTKRALAPLYQSQSGVVAWEGRQPVRVPHTVSRDRKVVWLGVELVPLRSLRGIRIVERDGEQVVEVDAETLERVRAWHAARPKRGGARPGAGRPKGSRNSKPVRRVVPEEENQRIELRSLSGRAAARRILQVEAIDPRPSLSTPSSIPASTQGPDVDPEAPRRAADATPRALPTLPTLATAALVGRVRRDNRRRLLEFKRGLWVCSQPPVIDLVSPLVVRDARTVAGKGSRSAPAIAIAGGSSTGEAAHGLAGPAAASPALSGGRPVRARRGGERLSPWRSPLPTLSARVEVRHG
jgi:hypothetical protein